MIRRGAAVPPGAPGRRQVGFTLIEVLLVLAVIALVASLVLPGLAGIFRTIEGAEPERILWDAVTAARDRALTANREVTLRYDRESHQLAWSDGVERQAKAWPADVTLQLLRAKEGGATVLIGGQLVETEEIPTVRFYADGTCDRFRAQLRSGNAAARVIGVDPWTCAPVLPAPTP
jgi:prepilin-type N-terminal cleavage/methylation domain-containing protein